MFPPPVMDRAKRHAEAEYPNESCGLITADGYQPFPNIHPDPLHYFAMPEEAEAAIAAGEALALVHSHSEHGLDHPSAEDQRQQLAMDIPWGLTLCRHGIVSEPFFWGRGIPEQPIMPRDFRWGPTGTDGRGDCAALLTDWYRQDRGLELVQQPRDGAWEHDTPTLYEDAWLAQGFTPVPETDLRHGDMVMFAIQSRGRSNHAGIYLGGDILLHCLQNRLVTRESYGFWRRAMVTCLRAPAAANPREASASPTAVPAP